MPAEGEAPALRAPGTPLRDVRAKRPPALSFLLRMETLRRLARWVSLLALDYAAVFGALLSALALKTLLLGGGSRAYAVALDQAQSEASFAFLLTALLFARSDLYADRPRRPGFPKIASSLFLVTIVALIYALANGQHFDSYYVFYSGFFFGVLYAGTLRSAHTWLSGRLLSKAGYRRRALIVGSGAHIEQVAATLAKAAHTPIDLVGFISLTPRPSNGLRSLGTLAELPAALGEHKVQEVIIADPDFPQERAVELVDVCHERGVTVHVAPSTMEILLQRAEFVPGQSVPLFTLKPPVFEGFDFVVKRAFDLVGATLLLLVLSPILLGIALLVRLGSRGPILYRSIRPGMGGSPFPCLKFRTMEIDAEARQQDLEKRNEASGALFKISRDPRVTRVGKVLRRYSFDELPQLVNVLRGEMSLVGPRPLPTRDYERLEDWHRKRYLVLPGMTGLWQVSGRSDLAFDDLVRLDFLYLERWSIFLDLSIILKTIPAVLGRRGAF